MWTLSPYVTTAPNTKSILSAFNTPFNPHKVKCPVAHSRVEGKGSLSQTEPFDVTIGKSSICDGLKNWSYMKQINSVIMNGANGLGKVGRLCEDLQSRDKVSSPLNAVVLALSTEGHSTVAQRKRQSIGMVSLRPSVSSYHQDSIHPIVRWKTGIQDQKNSEQVVNKDGQLKVTQRHLVQGLRPLDGVPDRVWEVKKSQGYENEKGGIEKALSLGDSTHPEL
ncbi:hypothetical protein BKA82DRAFT_4016831 [Pisolithus tinctorius]|nr:hypothetical protein BKA82DRAFT_4016831 [Pisolithus tinctorius]